MSNNDIPDNLGVARIPHSSSDATGAHDRYHNDTRAFAEVLDRNRTESTLKLEENIATGKEEKPSLEDVICVNFEVADPRNPFNFTRARKWSMTLLIVVFTSLTVAAGPTFALGTPSMMRDLKCSEIEASAGLGLYAFGFGVAPLFLASFSEEFGRNPIYITTSAVYSLCFIPVALARNISVVIVFRFLGGAAASTGTVMVGGSLADMWITSERGVPMAIFSLSVFVATSAGPVIGGWIEANQHLEWRWIQWLQLIASAIYTIILAFGLKETRGSVLLAREAKRLREQTGDDRYRAAIEPPPLKKLIKISLTRPVYLLFTEPVVAAFSLWIGFAWGVLYGLVASVSGVFRTTYGFHTGEAGSVFTSVCVGAFLGFGSTWYQERLYARYFKKHGPEARLYASCAAGVLFPVGCFIYAWTSDPSLPWIAPVIGITVIIWSIYIIYAAVFNYLADCYLVYASSALAGQSLCRNLAAAAFPLFANKMYNGLTYKWASTLLGCVAAGLGVIPFVLFFWGSRIRSRSRFAKKMAQLDFER